MKADVVIPLGRGSRWGDNELRFCLRALEKNFLDLGNVWIVGEKPDWCVGVRYLRMPDFFTSNKDANLITKVMTACYQHEMTPQFVRSSDDEILLRPTRFDQMRPYHQGEISRPHGNRWHRRLDRTGRWLRRRGLTALNYDSHLPVPMGAHAAGPVPGSLPPGLVQEAARADDRFDLLQLLRARRARASAS